MEIRTPKIIPGESEGGAGVFTTDYFGRVSLRVAPRDLTWSFNCLFVKIALLSSACSFCSLFVTVDHLTPGGRSLSGPILWSDGRRLTKRLVLLLHSLFFSKLA